MLHIHFLISENLKVVTSSAVKSSSLAQPLWQKLTSAAENLDLQRVSSCQEQRPGFYSNLHFSCIRFSEESAAKTSWSEGVRAGEAWKAPEEV